MHVCMHKSLHCAVVAAAVTEWVGKWKRNGWKTSQAEPVKNREDIERLDSACQKIHVKWVSGEALYIPRPSSSLVSD